MAEDKKNQTQDKDLTMDDMQKISDSIAKNNKKTTLEFIDKASYTKTFVKCKITEVLGNYNYKVWVNGAEYTIKCEDSDFSISDLVTVIVPNNNWSNMYIDFKKGTNSEGWARPKEWLTLPPALTGEITMLVNNATQIYIFFNQKDGISPWSCTVDWGDGIIENYNNNDSNWGKTHSYTTGGHQISNGTKQYIVTIKNMVNCRCNCNKLPNLGILLASINCDISTFEMMFEAHKELCQIDVLCGASLPKDFCSFCFSLKRLNLASTILSIGESACSNCLALYYINSGKLTSVGKQAFAYNYGLNKISLVSNCVIGEDAFIGCPSLHPTPV